MLEILKIAAVAAVVSLVVTALNNRFEIPVVAPKAGAGTVTRNP